MVVVLHGWGLEWYLTLAETGHMTTAAARLGIPQSTLSRRLARLEADLGTALFDRVGGGLRLNERGRVLRAHLGRAAAEVHAGVAEVRRLVDPDRGTVRLDFLHSLGTWLMPQVVRGFLALHPGVDFRLFQGPGIDLSARVLRGDSDIALVTPRPEDSQLEWFPLVRQRLALAVPAGHRLAGRHRVHIREAAGEPFATLRQGYGTRQVFDELCAAGGFVPDIVFEAAELPTTTGLVSARLALAMVPLDDPTPLPENTVAVPLDTGLRREIGMVRQRRSAPNPPVDMVWDFIVGQAESARWSSPADT